MTSIDGEYILLGRKTTEDRANAFVEYDQSAASTVNLKGGPGIQEFEFIDGLRMSVAIRLDMPVNANIVSGVQAKSLPKGTQALSK